MPKPGLWTEQSKEKMKKEGQRLCQARKTLRNEIEHSITKAEAIMANQQKLKLDELQEVLNYIEEVNNKAHNLDVAIISQYSDEEAIERETEAALDYEDDVLFQIKNIRIFIEQRSNIEKHQSNHSSFYGLVSFPTPFKKLQSSPATIGLDKTSEKHQGFMSYWMTRPHTQDAYKKLSNQTEHKAQKVLTPVVRNKDRTESKSEGLLIDDRQSKRLPKPTQQQVSTLSTQFQIDKNEAYITKKQESSVVLDSMRITTMETNVIKKSRLSTEYIKAESIQKPDTIIINEPRETMKITISKQSSSNKAPKISKAKSFKMRKKQARTASSSTQRAKLHKKIHNQLQLLFSSHYLNTNHTKTRNALWWAGSNKRLLHVLKRRFKNTFSIYCNSNVVKFARAIWSARRMSEIIV